MNSPFFIAIIALVGVALGGCLSLLSPLVQGQVEKSKRKLGAEQQLIKLISVFSNHRKMQLSHANNFYFNHRKLVLEMERFDQAATKEVQDKIQRTINLFAGERLNHREGETLYRNLLTETEGDILSCVHELSKYYDSPKFIAISNLIDPLIKKGNEEDGLLHEYDNLTINQASALEATFFTEVGNLSHSIQKEGEDIIAALRIIFE